MIFHRRCHKIGKRPIICRQVKMFITTSLIKIYIERIYKFTKISEDMVVLVSVVYVVKIQVFGDIPKGPT